MRISKLYLAVCVVALGAGVVTIRADDNSAQAAARAALEAKMRALNAQPESTNPPASAPVRSEQPVHSAVTPAPATPKYSAPVAATPAGTVVHVPTNPPPATTTTPATSPAAAPTRTSAPTVSGSNHGLFSPVPPPSGSGSGSGPAISALRVAQPARNVQTPPPAAPQKRVSKESPQNTGAVSAATESGFQPIQAPPPPISARQQAQLQALLAKYDANTVTPEQYQAERAKILAERK